MTNNYSEELDFRLLFGESTFNAHSSSLGLTESRTDDDGLCYPFFGPHHNTELQDSSTNQAFPNSHPTPVQLMESPNRVFDCPSIQITSIPTSVHPDLSNQHLGQPAGAYGEACSGSPSRDQLFLPLDAPYRDTSSLCPSPCSSMSSRSWLSDASSCESFSHVYDDVEAELNEAAAQVHLASPRVSPLASPVLSPLTSPQASPQVSPFGSPGFLAGYGDDLWYRYLQHQCPKSLSPYQSPRASVTEETWLSPRPQSSTSRPSSRPTSPCGKRRHSSAEAKPGVASPQLSPNVTPSHSPRGSVTEETWIGGANFVPHQDLPPDIDVPSKTRRTYQTNHGMDQSTVFSGQDVSNQDSAISNPSMNPSIIMSLPSLRKEDLVEQFLAVPTQFPWVKPKQTSTPFFRSTSLPLLDCPLPSQYGQFELKIEIQPKQHHRAHYETEGSRGAIKSDCGRHPVVQLIGYNEKPISLQMFIGTADERFIRPHPFYQVHRITGKTVATLSQDTVISNTKVLEIPLLPENNMCASIDCAGILKLRNSDIELRKGETDIGRKNTRVRAVFRVHIPQLNGKVLSLQVASVTIECSQRLAQELPQVESFHPSCCSVAGGDEMRITGLNIYPESTVVFIEKAPDGKTQWEVNLRALPEKSQNTCIVVKVPPYYKKTTASSSQVQFYVTNGKKKRSGSQFFTYLSAGQIKQECDTELVLDDLGGQRPSTFSSVQIQPLEEWMLSEGSSSSSAHPRYSPRDALEIGTSNPPNRIVSAGVDAHAMLPPSLMEYSNSLFQKPQQDISYIGLPTTVKSFKSTDQPMQCLSKGYQSLYSDHTLNLQNLGYVSIPGTAVLTSHNVYTTGPHAVGPVPLPQLSSSQFTPLSHQPSLSKVPSDSKSLRKNITSLQESSKSCNTTTSESSLNIKQEPEEEKDLHFRSLGLQDITLDDVSEIIVRDLYETPESGNTNRVL
ncbi:hypothetical protein DNTS_011927 [Danionella cerebrum]|uniref:RHD domain-containing protein n=1 Tax=Danionella cerebrum TaxID=2873325 RepID=A0A553Q7K1_9TELE|nr:hypothetical protein DNTS_011927 [Danionella translucida]